MRGLVSALQGRHRHPPPSPQRYPEHTQAPTSRGHSSRYHKCPEEQELRVVREAVATGHTRCEKRPGGRTALNTGLREGSLQHTVGWEGGGGVGEGREGGKGRPEQPEPAEETGLTGNPLKRKWDEQKKEQRWGRKVSSSRKSQNRKVSRTGHGRTLQTAPQTPEQTRETTLLRKPQNDLPRQQHL